MSDPRSRRDVSRGVLTALLKAAGYYLAYRLARYWMSELFVAAVRAMRAAGLLEGVSAYDLSRMISIGNHAVFALAIVLWFCLRRRPLWSSLGMVRIAPLRLVPCFLCGCGATVTVGWLYRVIPFPAMWQAAYNDSTTVLFDEYSVWTFVLTVCVAPLMEEVIFRSLLFGRLRAGMPFPAAATLSAAVFGAAHGNLLWALYAFALGLFLAWLFERTGSLWASVLCHVGFNLVGQLSIGALPFPLYMTVCVLATATTVTATWWLCRLTRQPTTYE